MNRYSQEEKTKIIEFIECQSNTILFDYYEEVEESKLYNKEEKAWIMLLIKEKMLK